MKESDLFSEFCHPLFHPSFSANPRKSSTLKHLTLRQGNFNLNWIQGNQKRDSLNECWKVFLTSDLKLLDAVKITFSGNKTFDQRLGANWEKVFVKFFNNFLAFYYFFAKNVKNHFSTSILSAQHTNTGQNIQQLT